MVDDDSCLIICEAPYTTGAGDIRAAQTTRDGSTSESDAERDDESDCSNRVDISSASESDWEEESATTAGGLAPLSDKDIEVRITSFGELLCSAL